MMDIVTETGVGELQSAAATAFGYATLGSMSVFLQLLMAKIELLRQKVLAAEEQAAAARAADQSTEQGAIDGKAAKSAAKQQ